MRRDVTSRPGTHISELVKTLLNILPLSDAVSNKGLRPPSLCCGCRYYEKRHIKSPYLFHVRQFSRGTPHLCKYLSRPCMTEIQDGFATNGDIEKIELSRQI
jgi:hypothetical protein